MKTLEVLYKEVLASDELKKEFLEAAKTKEASAEWLKKHDCSASAEDLREFLLNMNEGEMDDEDVESVAGGKVDGLAITGSVLTLGGLCAILAFESWLDREMTVGECFEEPEN